MSRVSGMPIAIGFSQNVAMRASRHFLMSGACVSVGVTMTAVSTPLSASSTLVAASAFSEVATSSARAGSASYTRSSSTSFVSLRTLAWNAPRRPTPRMATRTTSILRWNAPLRQNRTVTQIRGVLFDWGDTLFSPPDAGKVIVAAAAERGVRIDPEKARSLWDDLWEAGKTPEELAKGRDLSAAAHRKVWAALFERANTTVPDMASVFYERVMD